VKVNGRRALGIIPANGAYTFFPGRPGEIIDARPWAIGFPREEIRQVDYATLAHYLLSNRRQYNYYKIYIVINS
jgi:hypothetical protein